MGKFLEEGCDVYPTLVDDQKIDCIIRIEKKVGPKYLDIQIKARSKEAITTDKALFAGMVIKKPRKNYFFIFYSEQFDKYWIIPSLDLVKLSSRNKKGNNKGKYSVKLENNTKIKGNTPKKQFDKYVDAWKLLKK